MKKLVLILMILPIFAVAEGSVVMGSFGTDGASGDSQPFVDSADNAAIIYESLKESVPSNESGDITVHASELDFWTCSEPKDGVHSLMAKCEFVSPGRVMEELDGSTTASLSTELSELLFNALPKSSETIRMGATTREVANLQCWKALVSGGQLQFNCNVFKTDAFEVPGLN